MRHRNVFHDLLAGAVTGSTLLRLVMLIVSLVLALAVWRHMVPTTFPG